MSEYQYYEFRAIDRQLDAKAMSHLRSISSRARITSSSFINHYDWGDLKADPMQLLARYFDLFLYTANWGTRWFAVKLPKRLVDVRAVKSHAIDDGLLDISEAGDSVILSIRREEIEADLAGDDNEDGHWLTAIAPLRAELIGGDLTLLTLLWLVGVQDETIEDDEVEPSPPLVSVSPALSALADFLDIDRDLIEAASGESISPAERAPVLGEVESFLRKIAESEKVALLRRVFADEPLVGAELRQRFRRAHLATARDDSLQARRRTAGELRAAAHGIAAERERRAEERAATKRRRQEREAAEARARRIVELAKRGEQAWRDVEAFIEMRNPKGYEQATLLLGDLGALADKDSTFEAFAARVATLRIEHAGKRKFIERLDAAGLPDVPQLAAE